MVSSLLRLNRAASMRLAHYTAYGCKRGPATFQKCDRYRKDSEMMIFTINNVIAKDTTIATQQAQVEALRQEVQSRGNEIGSLQKR